MSADEENPRGNVSINDVLMPKKGECSTVWKFLRFKPDNDSEGVTVCKQCFGSVTVSERHQKIQHELSKRDKGTTFKILATK